MFNKNLDIRYIIKIFVIYIFMIVFVAYNSTETFHEFIWEIFEAVICFAIGMWVARFLMHLMKIIRD